MVRPLEASIVRITTAENTVVGSGCFIGERRIITCAHVVACALRIPERTATAPLDAVYFDFPLVAPGCSCSSHIVLWRPPLPDGGGDVAVLQLDHDPPRGVEPVHFVQVEDFWGHPCSVFGFPQGEEAGVFATGQLLGRQGTGWIQIEDVKESGFPIEPGFSGAPVWDDRLKAVVGIVVACERRQQVKAAFLIPVDTLISLRPTIDMSALMEPIVFIVASPLDKDFVSQLSADLQERNIIVWHDRLDIIARAPDRQEAIREAVRTAQFILLVATPQTRTSQTVKEYLRIVGMYQRRLSVLWVAGNELMDTLPLGWGNVSWVDAHQTKYKEALNHIIGSLTASPGLPPSPEPEPPQEPRNPYKGLRAFTCNDAGDFFGREVLVKQFTQALDAILIAGRKGEQDCRLLAVVGPSGSGKSSVVMAGLLPRLQTGGLPGSSQWVYLPPIVPGSHPLESLSIALAEKFPNRCLKDIRVDLEDDTARGLHLLATLLVKQPHAKVVLVIDQFEELFKQTVTEEERERFIDILLAAVSEPNAPVIVILTLRADFYDRPMNYPELGKLIDAHHCSILPMGIDDLRSIIEKPAALADVQLTFEGELVGDLLYEMQYQPGALPLLQFTLDQLFERRQGHLLTLQAYREMGGIRGALVRHAEATYASLPSEQHRLMARELFLRLIDPGKGEQDASRRRAAMTELSLPDLTLSKVLQETAAAFTAARLLTANTIAGIPTIEVSHEALIWEWPRLTEWLQSHRDDTLLQQTISNDASAWKSKGMPADRLYRGEQLLEAQAWAMRNRPSVDEQAFLQASIDEGARQEVVERERQRRELKSQRRAKRRLYYFIGAVAALASVALIVPLAWNFWWGNLPVSVTNTNDSGPYSLRDAIKLARPGDAITFSQNLQGVIKLTSGELEISKNLEISGPGAGQLAISGEGRSRVFHIVGNAAVSISNITIENGLAPALAHKELRGGSVYDEAGSGGGIYNEMMSSLTLTNTTITDNRAIDGGSIGNEGYLTVTDSTISYGVADQDG
ncbi:MAG TPA: trypsin-like peptidase domain-containing protein, partial [Ktedonobacteraceae bacterium]|nr:trypsin-like peptidase domain-containing protein [Ktedonobacteraceae bacterium]